MKTRICPQCGDAIEVKLPTACESCGVWIEPTPGPEREPNGDIVCEECGLPLNEEDKFCRECGEVTDLGRTVESIEGFGEPEDETGFGFSSDWFVVSTGLTVMDTSTYFVTSTLPTIKTIACDSNRTYTWTIK